MCKPMGNWQGVATKHFLRAVSLMLLISPAVCHAQFEATACMPVNNITPSNQGTVSIDPVTWAPGHTYTVSITGGYPIALDQAYSCPDVVLSEYEWPDYPYALGVGPPAPYLSLSNLTYVSSTLTTFIATVAGGAPTGTIQLDLASSGYAGFWNYFGVQIQTPPPPNPPQPPQPPTCPTPALAPATSGGPVASDTWTPGQTYQIVVRGTGFTTAANATSSCPATQITVSVNTGSVTVSNVVVIDSTTINATITPADTDPGETAEVNLWGPPSVSVLVRSAPEAPQAPSFAAAMASNPPVGPPGTVYDGQAPAQLVKLYIIDPYLSPFNGAASISENSVISSLSNYPAVQAKGMITDGAATAIVVYQLGLNKEVTFEGSNGLRFESWSPQFLSYPPSEGTCGGVCTISIDPIHGSDGSYYAFALVLAPPQSGSTNYGPDTLHVASITASVATENGPVSSKPTYLGIGPTPVILVHGLWADDTSLSPIANDLNNKVPFGGNIPPYLYTSAVCYSKTLPFDATGGPPGDCVQTSEIALATIVDSVQQSVIDAQYVGGRFDFVAHSMGGLAMRHYYATDDYSSDDNKARTRTLGPIRTVITLDTPELGSRLALALLNPAIAGATCANRDTDSNGQQECAGGSIVDLIKDSPSPSAVTWAQTCTTNVRTTVAQCFNSNNMGVKPLGPTDQSALGFNISQCAAPTEPAGNVSCGAMASLIPRSKNINNLTSINNIRNDNLKWFVIESDWLDIPGNNSELRQFLNQLLAGITPAGLAPQSVCNASPSLTMLCLIGNDPNNDVIVTTTSQSDNSGGYLAEYSNVAHSAVPGKASALPGLRLASNKAITDGTADPCIEALLRTWSMGPPCPIASSSSASQVAFAGGTAQRSESEITPAPGESQEDAVERSAYPETLNPQRISIVPPVEDIPLGSPVHLVLTLAPGKINTVLYSQSSGGSELDSGPAKIVQDEGTEKKIEVTPLQLGPLEIWVTALYGDNAAAEQTIRLNVVPSSAGLKKFDLDEGVHSIRMTLGGEEWQREHWLVPVATYHSARYPIRLRDSSRIAFSIEQDVNNPVISVDNNGMIHALREGNADLTGEYAGVKDKVRVTVRSR